MTKVRRPVLAGSATAAFAATALIASTAQAGGLLLYEFGTAEPGLAAAGMTRLDGTQGLVGGQLMWLNTQFSVGSDTSPGLGSGDGGRAIGSNGYVPGGGAFLTHRVSPDLALGFAVGAQYRPNGQWKVNAGLAYDSGFQDGNDVSPLFPVNSTWRLGAGGSMDVDQRSTLPPVLGGRGNLVGSYDDSLAVYGNWAL